MKTVFFLPDERRARVARRRRSAIIGVVALIPILGLLGYEGYWWFTHPIGGAGPFGDGAVTLAAVLLGVLILPVVAVVSGVRFTLLGGRRWIGVVLMAAGPMLVLLGMLGRST